VEIRLKSTDNEASWSDLNWNSVTLKVITISHQLNLIFITIIITITVTIGSLK